MEEQPSIREKRKDEHVRLALNTNQTQPSDFDALYLVHRSLPELDKEEVDLRTRLGNLTLAFPIYINAMTGGSEKTGAINAALAEAAKETGIAMAVGSQHSGLRNEKVADTYRIVRKKNPNGVIFGNVGADAPLDYALRAIDMLEADALQIHLNVPQEVVMPEGDRHFSGILKKIETIIKKTSIPVIIKETGFGMCRETLEQLKTCGVQFVDVGGGGGTNFVHIENERREKRDYSYLKGWGQSTPISLLEAQPFLKDMTILASGGIRNPLDAVKSMALGASAAGVAGAFLRVLDKCGTEGLVEEMKAWKEHLRMIFLMQGAQSLEHIAKCPIIVTKNVREWCDLRGLDAGILASRSLN
ncbi:type 2 isopentenyl-diphosphate Delta-isomerase [Heyndrickxia acidicola]|uniref:Isopentenyl-diphosphate delta-isomerase n=1 Tax=Heyndrickxia acidicola TaxID=209389 RepID=A0ABU6MJH5_9BACI|nr:type 2 isopentenyl-diphosphate Delta-isomerase [Heyndrickxia acidicola]MED1204609.1 type 2 isopentenyl-diphosphate Delta-isomerase [Heyndrickxia acidicola]